jgi:hypothetical protein
MISISLSVIMHLGLAPELLHLSHAQNLPLAQWQQVNHNPANLITGRYYHAGAFLSSTNEYLVYGGFSTLALDDLHSIDLTTLQSTQLAESTPLGRRNGMAYTSDLVSNFYVHGGWTGSGILITFKMPRFLITTDLNSGLD